jgi:signal peptide peptidase-like protein 2B
MYCVASTSAITNVYAPLLWHCVPALKRSIRLPFLEQVSLSHIVCFFAGITIAAVWYALRFSGLVWPLHDLMSVSLCLQILSTVRFQDIKVSTVLLSLALLYDIFWVFISPLLFSENVMIATATGKGHTWSNTTDTPPAEMIPMLLVVPKVLDWAGGVTLLGLGDVVLPGLLVSFSLRVDVIKGYGWRAGYFGYMVCGYAAGLALAIFASVVMRTGQPALLYLVPCTLWPFLCLAYSRGELPELWQGLETARPSSMELLCPGSGDSSAGEDAGGRCEGGEEGGMEDEEGSRQRRPGDRLVEQEGGEDPNGAGGGGSLIGAERKGESRQRLLASKDKR